MYAQEVRTLSLSVLLLHGVLLLAKYHCKARGHTRAFLALRGPVALCLTGWGFGIHIASVVG